MICRTIGSSRRAETQCVNDSPSRVSPPAQRPRDSIKDTFKAKWSSRFPGQPDAMRNNGRAVACVSRGNPLPLCRKPDGQRSREPAACELGGQRRARKHRGKPAQRAQGPMRAEVAYRRAFHAQQHEHHHDGCRGRAVEYRAPVERPDRFDSCERQRDAKRNAERHHDDQCPRNRPVRCLPARRSRALTAALAAEPASGGSARRAVPMSASPSTCGAYLRPAAEVRSRRRVCIVEPVSARVECQGGRRHDKQAGRIGENGSDECFKADFFQLPVASRASPRRPRAATVPRSAVRLGRTARYGLMVVPSTASNMAK